MSLNKKAIQLLEENKYEAALSFFQQAVEERRDVQSLTNLTWIYFQKEDSVSPLFDMIAEEQEYYD